MALIIGPATKVFRTEKWQTGKSEKAFFCPPFFCPPFFCPSFFCPPFFCLPAETAI
jgi:hypothetical protein